MKTRKELLKAANTLLDQLENCMMKDFKLFEHYWEKHDRCIYESTKYTVYQLKGIVEGNIGYPETDDELRLITPALVNGINCAKDIDDRIKFFISKEMKEEEEEYGEDEDDEDDE